MKYKSGAALRQALEERLLDRARETGTSLVRLRKTVVFDRLLARLAVAARNRWVSQGRPGSRLQAWAPHHADYKGYGSDSQRQ